MDQTDQTPPDDLPLGFVPVPPPKPVPRPTSKSGLQALRDQAEEHHRDGIFEQLVRKVIAGEGPSRERLAHILPTIGRTLEELEEAVAKALKQESGLERENEALREKLEKKQQEK